MAFHVRDKATDAAVRRLAELKGKGLTEVIREAVENELAREHTKVPLEERLRALSERYRTLPKTGKRADKAFFDDLSGGV